MFLVHGTTIKNVHKILMDGYISDNPPKRNMTSSQCNIVFTQLLVGGLPRESTQVPCWFWNGIILDKRILKDYPFYATDIGGFANKFTDGKKKCIISGEGKLNRLPNV